MLIAHKLSNTGHVFLLQYLLMACDGHAVTAAGSVQGFWDWTPAELKAVRDRSIQTSNPLRTFMMGHSAADVHSGVGGVPGCMVRDPACSTSTDQVLSTYGEYLETTGRAPPRRKDFVKELEGESHCEVSDVCRV